MKVLLSSPITPFPPFKNGRDTLHHNYANTTYGQGIFSIPTENHYPGIHLIAQNISAQTTVLENPSRREFIRKVKAKYDIIGIYFVIPFFSKVLEMCRIVREHSAHSIIVLGGLAHNVFHMIQSKKKNFYILSIIFAKGKESVLCAN